MKQPTDLPSTAFMLAMRHQNTVISLETVCEQYLTHMNLTTAEQYANSQELPFPAFRMGNGKKARFFVKIADLAMWIDTAAEQAAYDWRKVNE